MIILMDAISHLDHNDYLLCLLGIAIQINWILKNEGDKYDDLEEPDFPVKQYIKKNVFDFSFIILSGFAVLFIVGEIFESIDTSRLPNIISDYSVLDLTQSMGSGLLGAVVMTWAIKFGKYIGNKFKRG